MIGTIGLEVTSVQRDSQMCTPPLPKRDLCGTSNDEEVSYK